MKSSALLFAAIATVSAEVRVARGGEEALLDVVQVTATRSTADAHQVSQAVAVVPRAEIVRNAPLTVVDHLRGEPGTYIQQTTPGQGIPVIRGLKGSEVLHLVDGFRLNNAIFRNAPNQYVALVDPWNLERVEVVRGPGAALHGGDAMGGVVQFLTRAPHFEGGDTRIRGSAGAQWTSADERMGTHVEAEAGNERFLTQLGASWMQAGELRVGGGESLPHTEFRSRGAFGRFAWRPDDGQTLVVQAQLNEQPDTPRFDALVPGFGQTRPDFSEHLFRPQRREFAQVRWTREASGGLADSLDLQIGAQRIVDGRVTRDFDAPHREIEHNASTLLGLIGHFTKQLRPDHSLSYGFETYHDTVESTRVRERLADGALSARPSRFPDGSTMRWIGAYATDRWTPSELLDVTAGARYTRYDIRLTPTINDTGVRLTPDDVSANAGVVFHMNETFNLVANLGQGFRPPNVFDLGTFGARGNRFSVPNPDLSPERVTSFDAGVKYSSARASAELIGFEARYQDKITQVLTGEIDAAGRFIVQSRNATRLTMRGVEAGATWQIGDQARLRATATWTRGDEQLEGDTYAADRIPPLFGRVALRVGGAAWSLEPSIYWATSQRRLSPRDAIDPRINPEGTDGWISAGLRARWAPRDAFALQAGVDNLADRRYREHGSGYDAPGRNAFATVNFSF